MAKYRGQFTVSAMCRVLEVSASGFYGWLSRPESARSRSNRRLLVEIKAVHKASKRRYGSPRVYWQLKRQGVACSENRVARLMRLHGLRAVQARRFKATTDSAHALPVAENVLDREFGVERADAAWVADISYVWTQEGWLYLAVVMDLFSRRVLGWSAQATLERSLVVEALREALPDAASGRRPAAGLLHHSDRGSQYASDDYQKLLQDAAVVCSMSRKANCWDNAPAESFFSTLKRELVYQCRFRTRAEARSELFEFIEVWYNRKRLHSSLGYMSPVDFEAQQLQEQEQQSTRMAA